ncbi:2-hydroxyacid dehydrogenase [Fuerstiella marisgermanici]|uniref:Glycerate dehydrogenase n=1 Tax=Fuerstiella marisgermanici TaxID=1891926 RepID=A0A1P8WQA6_9PLAN|nr:NAD(P)-dependent oxidoreductase [Fuerstiella marisgermanici]APZ96235.1 Glycerate dehydrogenase [Fuerstiella marisgermanici]
MKSPIVVIPGDDPPLVGGSQHLNQLRDFADVRYYGDRPSSDSEMLERLAPADVLLNSRSAVKVSGDVLNQLPNLKMIAVCGIGYDSIDIDAASNHGIIVSNIPGRTATVVAEHAFGLMLAVSRRMALMTEQLRAGQWSSEMAMSLIGKRIGVIGTGNIGLEMIRLCSAFGMEIVAWTFHPDEATAAEFGFRYVSLDELLSTSDVVSLHVRLSDETRGMIGALQLQQMKPGAILINTARAAVVDTSALAAALNEDHLFGAGVDVYDAEPTADGNPLLSCRNVVLTPHTADRTPEGLDLLTLGCVENIRAFLDGRPQNVVNASRPSSK